ncbi:nucleotide 5'-monophosphate nucleosidase PpnN [Gynuella sp.]|uniref:nucleotide 5'-monophosphate nucleosidase PpnN n=1 Tax=Gynuella sp. TaxID=2969146 RepID=UPI003D0D52AE
MSHTTRAVKSASLSPRGSLEILSQQEVAKVRTTGQNGMHELFRRCALAILNTGSDVDNAKTLLEAYPDFDIELEQQDRGIKLIVKNAPAEAFVDDDMISSTREMLFSALRDIVYSQSGIDTHVDNLKSGKDITEYVFRFLRNARAFAPGREPNLVVCWGGHSINNREYKYTKNVGHELGLRGMNICTGCGPGAMKGPMKGGIIAHAKQRVQGGRYLGITEPGIIAAEAPNPIVNELVIMPDIEKRLEAFVRIGHGIVIFPGGAGTAEELLYILGILLHPDNISIPFPLILTGPKESEDYFQELHEFINTTLGFEAQQKYKIVIDNPAQVAREMAQGLHDVREFRIKMADAFHFNWLLTIDKAFQQPFEPSHENMAKLELSHKLPVHTLAANLRRAFSGIVAGNVKEQGIRTIEEKGPFEINGDPRIMEPLDRLLQAFVEQHRMKLPGAKYEPCYRLKK